ncbi:hypothetical protein HMPREF1989_01868 [Porphyromonas gingivalis F0566]|nr:hypothetical protein HMPREF1989_01868 [Porphyromonas gingivalis F0566]
MHPGSFHYFYYTSFFAFRKEFCVGCNGFYNLRLYISKMRLKYKPLRSMESI